MSRGKIENYLKQNPDVFNQAGNERAGRRAATIADKDIPPKTWLTGNHAAFKTRKREKRPWYTSKGLWIPVASCLVLAVLLGATSWGRATASTAYNTVVKFFAGGANMTSGKGDNTAGTAANAQGTTLYSSIDEVKNALGRKVAYNSSAGYAFETAEVFHDGFNTIIETAYKNGQDTIILKQTVSDSMTEWSNTQKYNFDKPFHEKLFDGTDVVGYIYGTHAYAVAFKSDILLEFSADGVGYENFCAFIRDVHFKQ